MIQIKLKQKYRQGFKSRYKGGENPAKKKKRNKIGNQKHVALFGEPPEVMLVVDGLRGTGVIKKTRR